MTRPRAASLAGVAVVCAAALAFATVDGHGVSCATALAASSSTAQEATNYVLAAGTDGNCSLPAPPDDLFVALPASEYDAGAECGSYLEVTGPLGSVRVKVIDQCPECAAGHIDLSQAAFSRIGVLSQGLIPVTYRTLVNPALPGPLTVRVKEGSSRYWLAVLVDNHGNALTSVRAAGPGGAWQNLAATDYGYWIAASGAGPGPFMIEVSDGRGHTATVPGVALDPGVVQTSTVMMYGPDSAAPPTAGSTTATPASRSPDSASADSQSPVSSQSAGLASADAAESPGVSAAAPTASAARCTSR